MEPGLISQVAIQTHQRSWIEARLRPWIGDAGMSWQAATHVSHSHPIAGRLLSPMRDARDKRRGGTRKRGLVQARRIPPIRHHSRNRSTATDPRTLEPEGQPDGLSVGSPTRGTDIHRPCPAAGRHGLEATPWGAKGRTMPLHDRGPTQERGTPAGRVRPHGPGPLIRSASQ